MGKTPNSRNHNVELEVPSPPAVVLSSHAEAAASASCRVSADLVQLGSHKPTPKRVVSLVTGTSKTSFHSGLSDLQLTSLERQAQVLAA